LNNAQVIRAEIMHREHPSSPLSTAAYKTPRERFVAAVQRSHLRARAFAQHIEDAAVNVGASQFTSSVKSGVGEYLMNIAIGTPPQTFTTIMDTGSDLVWTQCDPCNECYPQKDAVFNPAASSTYQLLSCTSPLCLVLKNPCFMKLLLDFSFLLFNLKLLFPLGCCDHSYTHCAQMSTAAWWKTIDILGLCFLLLQGL